MPHARPANRLIHETSPYLLQHARNPVDWWPWGEEAFREARERDVPILLSVGYSACHWCHVMERESFENDEIAALMNQHFVCVKVDREERPDVDQIYMTAVQLMTGQGGWPMTVFLTPDGKPFYGGTYYPPDDRYGRPGFRRVLLAVADAWQNRRDDVAGQGEALAAHIGHASQLDVLPAPVTPGTLEEAFRNLRAGFDARFGGWGGAPKFPQPMVLDFLLRWHARTGNEDARRMADLTLEKMAFGGIYDQLGGGFHRYSVDDRWLVPHFEKMLYDNAQLARTYLHGWQATRDDLYLRVATETLDYVLREMTGPGGGFYSAQDADSEGEEGKFFVWTPAEIEAELGTEDSALFCQFFDVTPQGNFDEGKSVLSIPVPVEALARDRGDDPETLQARLDALRRRLFSARERRVKPALDDKVLVSWNGLMLAAMAETGAVLEREDYLRAAVACAEFVRRELMVNGRLLRTGRMTDSGFRAAPIPGFLEDHAFFADGLVHLYQATFDRQWLDLAVRLAEQVLERFDDGAGGFFDTAHDAEPLIQRPRDLSDNATPAGSSVAAEVLLRLAVLTGREEWRERAAECLRRTAEAMARHPLAFGRALWAADFHVGPVRELAVVGDPASGEFRALVRVARERFRPNLVLAGGSPRSSAEEIPLLQGRTPLDGRAAAYLCENYGCRQPVSDPESLAAQLAG